MMQGATIFAKRKRNLQFLIAGIAKGKTAFDFIRNSKPCLGEI